MCVLHRVGECKLFEARTAVISSFGKKTPLGGNFFPASLRNSRRFAHFCINWEWRGDSCCTWHPKPSCVWQKWHQNRPRSVLGFTGCESLTACSKANSAVSFQMVKSTFVPTTLHFQGFWWGILGVCRRLYGTEIHLHLWLLVTSIFLPFSLLWSLVRSSYHSSGLRLQLQSCSPQLESWYFWSRFVSRCLTKFDVLNVFILPLHSSLSLSPCS